MSSEAFYEEYQYFYQATRLILSVIAELDIMLRRTLAAPSPE
jgi:hypothetical protein